MAFDPAQSCRSRGVAEPGQTVLIIEDNEELRDLLVEFLRDDFRMMVADDADEGLAAARSMCPDLILCDLNLPGKNGLHTIEALRRDPALAHVPVILMSGQEAPAAAAALAARFLPKPFSVETLMDALRAVLATTRPLMKPAA
jgi:CheY-like chemotaxis protein